jgi:hypothetical protein
VADQRAEAYAQAIGSALDQAGIPDQTDLLLVARGGEVVDPLLVELLAQGRRVRLVVDEAAEFGPPEQGSPVPDGAALVALRTVAEAQDSYRIRLAVYTSMHNAVGGTYLVERAGPDWAVTEVEDFFDLRSP